MGSNSPSCLRLSCDLRAIWRKAVKCCQGTNIHKYKMHSQFGNIPLLEVGIAGCAFVEIYVVSSRKGENGRGLILWAFWVEHTGSTEIAGALNILQSNCPRLTGHVRSTGGSCCRRNAAFNSCSLSTSFPQMERFDQGNRPTCSFPSPQFIETLR